MEPIQYLQATQNDIDILTDYRMRFSDELLGKQDAVIEDKLRESLRNYFEGELNKNYFCWYAKVNDTVAGIGGMCIRVYPGNVKNISGKWGSIVSMYTLPQFRRRGIAGNIVNRLVETGKELGITAFELHATKEGEAVYVRQGFRKHDEPTYRKWL